MDFTKIAKIINASKMTTDDLSNFLKEVTEGSDDFKKYIKHKTIFVPNEYNKRKTLLQKKNKLLDELKEIENELVMDKFEVRQGVNKSNKLHYVNLMTKENFEYADNPKKAKTPHELEPKELLQALYDHLKAMNLDKNTLFYVNFDAPDGHKTYKSVTLKEFKKVVDEFDIDTDEYFEEYNIGNVVYGVSASYK